MPIILKKRFVISILMFLLACLPCEGIFAAPKEYKTFKNDKFNFSISIPRDYNYTEIYDPNGLMSAVSSDGAKSIQVSGRKTPQITCSVNEATMSLLYQYEKAISENREISPGLRLLDTKAVKIPLGKVLKSNVCISDRTGKITSRAVFFEFVINRKYYLVAFTSEGDTFTFDDEEIMKSISSFRDQEE